MSLDIPEAFSRISGRYWCLLCWQARFGLVRVKIVDEVQIEIEGHDEVEVGWVESGYWRKIIHQLFLTRLDLT